jgi:hypothetical protein
MDLIIPYNDPDGILPCGYRICDLRRYEAGKRDEDGPEFFSELLAFAKHFRDSAGIRHHPRSDDPGQEDEELKRDHRSDNEREQVPGFSVRQIPGAA